MNRSDRNVGVESPSENVKKEVARLLNEASDNDYAVLANLRGKFKDPELVNAIFDHYKSRLEEVQKTARKFRQVLFDRYSSQQLPFPKLLKKAMKYKKKYDLSDDEFQIFLNDALSSKQNTTNMYNLPNTRISRTLGYGASAGVSDKLNVPEKELGVLNDVVTLHGQTRPLHAQVVLQSMTYKDCAPEALLGKFNSEKHNAYQYVHPVVAALFLPRIRYLDEHMLIANIGYIVKCKREGIPIMTKPDYELYWDIITDPNEVACDVESPIVDLKNRFQLQTRLWDSVLSLRQGRYYEDNLSNFLVAVQACRGSIYDAADMTYVNDEGTILRRILSAFSLRPTIVSTTPLYGLVSNNPYLNTPAMTQVTSIPMVTLRLPLQLNDNVTTSIRLANAVNQAQWFVENKMIVPKSQSIMYSRDVMFFYVNRRYQTINVGRVTAPHNFSSLPMTVAGFERLNDRAVNVDSTLNINNDYYELRTVVCIERATGSAYNNLITGCTTAVRIPRDLARGHVSETYLLYDPQGAGSQILHDGQYVANAPVSYIAGSPPFAGGDGNSFMERARTRGTIFVYQKVTNNDAVLKL